MYLQSQTLGRQRQEDSWDSLTASLAESESSGLNRKPVLKGKWVVIEEDAWCWILTYKHTRGGGEGPRERECAMLIAASVLLTGDEQSKLHKS